MRLKDALKNMDCGVAACDFAKRIAEDNGFLWDDAIRTVFSAIAQDHERAPGNIGGQNDSEHDTMLKWIRKYYSGKENRASLRASNLPGTVADPAIEGIIGARLSNLSQDDLSEITDAHRLAMSAENILGLLLEEYLAENLLNAGWFCAWGETVKSVDFVHQNGNLLQIKNRSNSENSSSSAIRSNTSIQKWYRIEAVRIQYRWDDLNSMCDVSHLSEENFMKFVTQTLNNNPQCLAVEPQNQWLPTY